MLKGREQVKCARSVRAEYMENHHLMETLVPFNTVIPKRGVINAIKRFMRRQWVKEGYLDDAEWLLNNGSYKLHLYALDNLERNGWTLGKIYGQTKG